VIVTRQDVPVWLSSSEAVSVLTRVAPVLGFLVAMTVLADLCDAAGLFEVAAARAARIARGRIPVLFALVVLLATVTTIVLSLDTTAVLLTPVVLALAQGLELDPWPFALATVWLANTASLLLPVSNLTNLLALDRLDLSTAGYVSRLALPALVAVAVTVAVLVATQRRHLRGRYRLLEPDRHDDRLLLVTSATACALLVPALVLGAPAWAAATAAAVVVSTAFGVRRQWPAAVPWRLVLLVMGLFLVVSALGTVDLPDAGALGTSATAAVAANGLDNLPAYLAMERSVPHDLLPAVLLGVNLGPLVTPWGSLATLLWAERCRAAGLQVSWLRFAALGLLLVPLLLVATAPLL
jgi:arsenical pump membrane protein